jgi:putative transposase
MLTALEYWLNFCMPRKPRILFEGAIYHVTFRGNNRQPIFEDLHDRKRMIERLTDAADMFRVRIYQYCLMTNHVHLLVETPLGNLNKFMGSLLTGYTMYFNIRHQRSGHLLQGRYGAQVVSGDDYLLRLSRYIHLNPVRTEYWNDKPAAEKLDFLHRYAWSSFRGYAGLSQPEAWVDHAPLVKLIPGRSGESPADFYRHFVEAGLAESDEEMVSIMKRKPFAIGSDNFIKSLAAKKELEKKSKGPGLRAVKSYISPDLILQAVKKTTGASDSLIRQHIVGGPVRAVLAIAWQKYSGLSHREIAGRLEYKNVASVSALIARKSKDEYVREQLAALGPIIRDRP